MEIEIRVPGWVNSEDEGVCMLFAFLRRILIEYGLRDKPLDVYGSDVRRILNREVVNLHEWLLDKVDSKDCKIAKLSRQHFVFYMKNAKNDSRIVKLTKPESHVRWAYLMGITNYNLLEEDDFSLDEERRPHYTPMYKMDKELFQFTSRGRKNSVDY
jgi:hypothetical protein